MYIVSRRYLYVMDIDSFSIIERRVMLINLKRYINPTEIIIIAEAKSKLFFSLDMRIR